MKTYSIDKLHELYNSNFYLLDEEEQKVAKIYLIAGYLDVTDNEDIICYVKNNKEALTLFPIIKKILNSYGFKGISYDKKVITIKKNNRKIIFKLFKKTEPINENELTVNFTSKSLVESFDEVEQLSYIEQRRKNSKLDIFEDSMLEELN